MAITYAEKRQAATRAVERFNDAMDAFKSAEALASLNARVVARSLGVEETEQVDAWKTRLIGASSKYAVLMAQEFIEAVDELSKDQGATP